MLVPVYNYRCGGGENVRTKRKKKRGFDKSEREDIVFVNAIMGTIIGLISMLLALIALIKTW
jgi:hypothetical protein